MSDTITSPVITGAYTLTYRDPIWMSFTQYLANSDNYAVTIWEEAHAEHAERFPTVRGRAEEPDTYVLNLSNARDLADAEQTVRNLRAEVGRLSATVTTLRTEQIDGSDHRLTSFWERAQEAASNADYCEVFDNLAEELGGPRRQREFTFDVTLTVTVETSDPGSVTEDTLESVIYGMSHGTLRDAIQGYDQID